MYCIYRDIDNLQGPTKEFEYFSGFLIIFSDNLPKFAFIYLVVNLRFSILEAFESVT